MDVNTYIDVKPSVEEFQTYYNELMNVPTNNLFNEYRDMTVTIPVLDDPVSLPEVTAQVSKIRADKASGPDGIAPGVFKLHPVQWLIIITTLFNTVFTTARYPSLWTRAKLFTIFKKGDRKDVKN